MAASTGEVLSEREEKRLGKLRERLFESNWDSAEFKESLRDLVSKYQSTLPIACINRVRAACASELGRCLPAGHAEAGHARASWSTCTPQKRSLKQLDDH